MTPNASSIGDVGTATKTITDNDIKTFAALSGDENPLHLNDAYADETMFNGRIAHGTLVEGIISAALADLNGVIIYLGKELSFNAPVRPGDVITATAEIVESIGDNVYEVTITATTEDGTVVIEGVATIQINEEPEVTAEDDTSLPDDGADSDSQPQNSAAD